MNPKRRHGDEMSHLHVHRGMGDATRASLASEAVSKNDTSLRQNSDDIA